MKRKISSSWTFFYKFVFTMAWIGGGGFVALLLLLTNNNEFLSFSFVWILGSLIAYWGPMRLKRVEIDDEYIYISNFCKTISVPMSEITRVKECFFNSIHPIWISFKNTTEFGQKIVFMPKWPWGFFHSHPIVKELRSLAESKSTP